MTAHKYAIEIGDWLKKASEDLQVAKTIVARKNPAWAACFHCHQVAEKALKALLLYTTSSYPKEHDLIKLAGSVKQAGITTDVIGVALKTLADYYVGTRYPTKKSYELTHRRAREAIKHSEQVLKFVQKAIAI